MPDNANKMPKFEDSPDKQKQEKKAFGSEAAGKKSPDSDVDDEEDQFTVTAYSFGKDKSPHDINHF